MRIPAATAVSVVAALALAGCGSSSSGGTGSASNLTPTTPAASASATAPADPAQATAAITTTWTTFFHTGTPQKQAEALLENGSQLGAAINVAAKFQKKEKITEDAKVVSIAFTSPTSAMVTYNLLSHGSVLLPNATGTAVLQDGQWKVSQTTFCGLVGLAAGGAKIPGC